MGTDITTTKPARALAVYDKPLGQPLIRALEISQALPKFPCRTHFGSPETGSPRNALQPRNEWLPKFAAADAARQTLFEANHLTALDRATALQMVTALYGAFGTKNKREMLVAAIDMFESEDIVRVTARSWDAQHDKDNPLRQWRPLHATPAALALGCRMLIATHKFEPKPAELRAAVHDASNRLKWAYEEADEFCDMFIEADAILLLNACADWERPYLTERYRPLLKRVLELHESTENYWDGPDELPSPFQAAVEREQAKLAALPKPEHISIAACATKPAKKTKRAKKADA